MVIFFQSILEKKKIELDGQLRSKLAHSNCGNEMTTTAIATTTTTAVILQQSQHPSASVQACSNHQVISKVSSF